MTIKTQPTSSLPQRKPLGHAGTPSAVWLKGTPLFFITICSENRDESPLLPIAASVLESVLLQNDRGIWFVKCVVVMPDHVHLLVKLPAKSSLAKSIGGWKRYVAKQCGVHWQTNFFDHRIRNMDEETEKFEYIRQNPVRCGLCVHPEDWPWLWYRGMPSNAHNSRA